ncbi:MAG: NUDIX hydrolase [Thermodesulfobacteriota bacterium]
MFIDERSYPDRPWLGVGGIVFQGDRVLLVKRGKEPGRGKWSIPGGAVDIGEMVENAVKREIEEETGLQVEVLDLVAVFERILPDPQGKIFYHYVVLDYLCRVREGLLKAASDAAEADFFPLNQLSVLKLPQETERVIWKAYKNQAK